MLSSSSSQIFTEMEPEGGQWKRPSREGWEGRAQSRGRGPGQAGVATALRVP